MKIFGFAGFSGSGKTTLLEKVIPLLVSRALKVSLIKHAHHNVDIDKPGKDSYRHREAGCSEVMLVSGSRWALMHELRGAAEPGLEEQLARFSPCDLILVEGYKENAIPKIEVYRPSHGKPLMWPQAQGIVAIATDAPHELPSSIAVPVLDLNDPAEVADFVLRKMELA